MLFPVLVSPMHYIIKNTDRGTNWNKGARVKRVSDWSGDGALFTDAKAPGAAIWADRSEVEEELKGEARRLKGVADANVVF